MNDAGITAQYGFLTELYLSSRLSIKHLREDLQDTEFSLEFDPFRLYLFASHKEQGQITHFMPGRSTIDL